MQKIAHALDVLHMSIGHVLHEQQLHPHHPQKIHALNPADFVPHAIFCAWFLHQCVNNPEFPRCIIFADEAHFTREAVLNCRNSHIWCDANPYATQPYGFQQRFDISVWAGINNGHL